MVGGRGGGGGGGGLEEMKGRGGAWPPEPRTIPSFSSKSLLPQQASNFGDSLLRSLLSPEPDPDTFVSCRLMLSTPRLSVSLPLPLLLIHTPCALWRAGQETGVCWGRLVTLPPSVCVNMSRNTLHQETTGTESSGGNKSQK